MLKLNDILKLSETEIKNSKLELNMTKGKGNEQHIKVWLNSSDEDRTNGITDCSYWGWYGQRIRNFHPGQVVLSFVRLGYGSDEWLFVSAAEVIDVPKNQHANIRILDEYKSLFGKLIVQYKKGNTYSRYVFNLSPIIEKCIVRELLPQQFNYNDLQRYIL